MFWSDRWVTNTSKEKKITENDLFLFFGWFRKTKQEESSLVFHGDDLHVIFGYMQIGHIVHANTNYHEPEWMYGHPHLIEERRRKSNNAVYIAREFSTWNKHFPGFGVFNFDPSLVLTKEGHSRREWNLPYFFRKVDISYHSDNSWKLEYFESAKRGQEFVIESNDKVEEWAKKLIGKNITLKYRPYQERDIYDSQKTS